MRKAIMGINGQSHATTKLDIDLFQSIFEKSNPGVIIDSLEEAHGSGRGDNYTAVLYRVHLKGHRNTNEGKVAKWEKSVICKRLPDSRVRREAYRSEELFRNEVVFYTRIMPELQKFQTSKSVELFKAIPKCYLAQNDLVILEDLRVRNFEMPDRQSGLSYKQMVAVLNELARFHALSLAYKEQHPAEFQELMSQVVEGIFTENNANWYANYYKRLTKNTIEMVSENLTSNSKYVERLKNFIGSGSFFHRMVELVNFEPSLKVLCHGDCWTNNFLYVYDDDNNIQETCLVDFQLIRYGSPAMDLSNLIFCCTDKSLRRNHQTALLQMYHKELVKSMKLLGPLPKDYDEEQLLNKLQSDWHELAKFGLGLALDILPISTCGADEAPDLYTGRGEDSSETGQPELDVPPNAMCRQKMTDIVVDLVDAELL